MLMSKLPNYINKESIIVCSNKDLNDKYSAYMENNQLDSKGIAVVIMKNPASSFKSAIFYGNISYGNVQDIDKTTMHVIDYLFNTHKPKCYKEVYLLNLFPYFDNIPSALNLVYGGMSKNMPNLSIQNNLDEIRRVLNISGIDLYCAWGKASCIHKSIYKNTILRVCNLIRSAKIPGSNIFQVSNKNATTYKIPLTMNKIPSTYPTHGSKW